MKTVTRRQRLHTSITEILCFLWRLRYYHIRAQNLVVFKAMIFPNILLNYFCTHYFDTIDIIIINIKHIIIFLLLPIVF